MATAAALVAGCSGRSVSADTHDGGREDADRYTVTVTRQWGSDDEDGVVGAATDGQSFYLTGYAMGAIPPNDHAGNVDIFLTRAETDGTITWTRQYGTVEWDQPFAVAVGPDGEIYVTGGTFGDLEGHLQIGWIDVFLTRFDSNGNRIWTEVWGGPEEDIGYGVAVDQDGSIYVAGWTAGDLGGIGNAGETDNFLTKLDGDGTRLWTRQWGSEGFDDPAAAAVDSRNRVYVTGRTGGSLDGNPVGGSRDGFLTRYTSEGNQDWTRQWSTGHSDSARSVAIADDDTLFVGGYLLPMDSFAADLFVSRFDANGDQLWNNSWGTFEIENGWWVTLDGAGDLLITGKTLADFGGINAGGNCGDFPCADVYVAKLTDAGELLWIQQWGAVGDDWATTVVVLPGVIMVAGGTNGDFGGPSAGSTDAFLSILTPPE